MCSLIPAALITCAAPGLHGPTMTGVRGLAVLCNGSFHSTKPGLRNSGRFQLSARAAPQMATRKTNPASAGAVVTAVPFRDARGNLASIVFTGATANRMASASCPCSPAQRRAGACTCIPDAGGRGTSVNISTRKLAQA